MFLLIDFDDIGEGLSSGISMFLKIFFTLGILGLIYVFVGSCDINIFVRIVAAISFTLFISNILTIIEGIKYLKQQKKMQEEKLYNEKYTKKVRNSLLIVTIATIILYIIGYFITFKFGNITIKGFASASIFTFFFNIVFCYLLNSNYIFEKKEFKTYISVIIDFLKGRLLGQVLPISIISLVIISVCCSFSQNLDDKNIIKNAVNNMCENINYYNNQYEKYRNGKTIKELAQDEINRVVQSISDKSEDSLYQNLTNDEIMNKFYNELGIEIKLSSRFRNEQYNHLFVLTIYDAAKGEQEYYKFDLRTTEIGDKFKNVSEANKYTEQIKDTIQSEKYQ